MNWTTPQDLRHQVERLWQRGDLLRCHVRPEEGVWPLRLFMKLPGARDLTDRFEEVRRWVRLLEGVPHVRLQWRQWHHRIQGRQSLPGQAWIETLDDALAMIGKQHEAQRFADLWQRTASCLPEALPWLLRHPHRTLDLADRWDRLLAVALWVRAHPRPGIYLRQVDVPGVDTKFIEANRSDLAGLLDETLPPEAIDASASPTSEFARRYGFLNKPVRIRLRVLDESLRVLPCRATPGLADITLDAASFAALDLELERVFITENETNFLAFPAVRGSIVIFGAGYGWQALAEAQWLSRYPIHYWGDIDTHGFAILDQLRQYWPHAQSFLMDEETLLAHREYWGEESKPVQHDLLHLTPTEAMLYDDLRCHRHRRQLRLEQERIGFGWVRRRLAQLG